jgi:hypothetical protein
VRGEWRQRFCAGEATLETNGVCARDPLPSPPVLFDVIARHNTLPATHRPVNIVGYDRPWRDRGRSRDPRRAPSCVLKADVQSFAALMRSGADGPVRAALEEACGAGAAGGDHRDRPAMPSSLPRRPVALGRAPAI